jgi:hypothetical protein
LSEVRREDIKHGASFQYLSSQLATLIEALGDARSFSTTNQRDLPTLSSKVTETEKMDAGQCSGWDPDASNAALSRRHTRKTLLLIN